MAGGRRASQLADADKVGLDWRRLAAVIRRALAAPAERHRALDAVAHAPVRCALEDWLDVYECALRALPGGRTAEGDDLRRGLDLIFQDVDRDLAS